MTSEAPHFPHGAVTVAELAGVVGWSVLDVQCLMSGAFAPGEDGTLSAAAALGIAVYAMLGQCEILPPGLASLVAGAATNADPAQDRSLVVTWRHGQPIVAWFGGNPPAPPADHADVFGGPLRRPTVCIPADQMAYDLIRAVALFRERDRLGSARQ